MIINLETFPELMRTRLDAHVTAIIHHCSGNALIRNSIFWHYQNSGDKIAVVH